MLQFTQEMGEAHLVVKKIKDNIRTVPVSHRYHIFQRIIEPVFKHLRRLSRSVETQRYVCGLCNLRPIKLLVVIASVFVKAHHGRFNHCRMVVPFVDGESYKVISPLILHVM